MPSTILVGPPYRRRGPVTIEYLLTRRIKAHEQCKGLVRADWEPICLFFLSRRFGLDQKIDRAVAVGGEIAAVAERLALKRVGDEIAILVIGCHGPENVDWRELALIEVQHVVIGSVERVTILVCGECRVDRVLRQILAEAAIGDRGPIGVVDAVCATVHRVNPTLAAFPASLLA